MRQNGDAVEVTHSASFLDRCGVVRSIVPEQTPTHLIARVRDIVFAPDGRFLVVDDSEGDVKLYDPAGQLRGVIGRRGSGPGEFRRPAFAVIGGDDRIYVVDTDLNRLQIFDDDGVLNRILNLDDFSGIGGFALLSDDSFAFLAHALDLPGDQDVLLHTDTLGGVLSSHLPIRTILPDGESDDPAWHFARNFFMDVRRDTAFVIASVENLLWRVDLPDGAVDSVRVEFPTYDRPRLPPRSEPIRSGQDMIDWFLDRHLTGFIQTTDETVLWPFIKGLMIDGDPVTLLHQTATGSWEVIEDAPIIVYASGDQVVAIEEPAIDAMRLIVYLRKG